MMFKKCWCFCPLKQVLKGGEESLLLAMGFTPLVLVKGSQLSCFKPLKSCGSDSIVRDMS